MLSGFGRNLSTHSLNGVAGWTHAVTPNFLNEARFGFLTVVGGQTSPNAGNFNIPNRTAFTANFGSISSSQDFRQLQLAGKFVF